MNTISLTRRHVMALLLSFTIIAQVACGPGTSRELKVDLNKAAATLNTASKENHLLYEQKVFGARALEIRVKVATAIHTSNELLIVALNTAKTMTPATFLGDKTKILELLGQAVNNLAAAHIGNERIDLLLQAAAASINSAIIIAQALKSADLRFITPAIQSWSLPLAA